MNEWDTIEKMINTLPQWDVIKWIVSIQEELKCAKEDNLYQLRQNKNLQSKIDKAIEYYETHQQECIIGRNKDDKLIKDYYLPAQCSKKLYEFLKEDK